MNSIPDETLDLLTAYALGALEQEEMARVSVLLREQPQLRIFLAELRATADMIPYALDAEPSPDLRQRTLDYALGRKQPAPAKRASLPWPRLTAMFGGLASVLAIAVILLWGQLNVAQSELARTRQEQRQIAEVLAQPNALVSLNGANGQGAVIRRADGSVVMAAHLPGLVAGRVYQFWYIQGANAPLPSNTFVVDQQGFALVTLNTDAQAITADTFAITEEPTGGSQAPTTKPLLVGSVKVSG
ncbi:MAG: anti-sigma factor [Roseiflexaceae bacterium]|nr:anti-sigma factor [Roseiflexaceae bacterium]